MKEKNLQDGQLYEDKFRYKERRQNAWFFLVLALFVWFIVGVRAYFESVYTGVEVSGPSMEQTLYGGNPALKIPGDKLLVKRTGWWHEADYGDVIVVSVEGYDEWQGRRDASGQPITLIIKRLIAKEGDKVKCVDGVVYLQKAGETKYTALREDYAYYSSNKAYYDFGVYEVGAGEIFFLGDNRFESQDSRYAEGQSQLGYLYKESDIIGTVPKWAIEHKKTLEKIFF